MGKMPFCIFFLESVNQSMRERERKREREREREREGEREGERERARARERERKQLCLCECGKLMCCCWKEQCLLRSAALSLTFFTKLVFLLFVCLCYHYSDRCTSVQVWDTKVVFEFC